MHGGSGLSHEDYKKVIECCVRKINYYTYMAKADGEVVSNKEYIQFHDAVNDVITAMKENVQSEIKVFSNISL